MNRLLALSALLEAATGLALMAFPSVVVRLLIGSEISGAGVPVGRVAGIALLSLGCACWPGRQVEGGSQALRAMLAYNGLVTIYLAYLGFAEHLGGPLLWPAVSVHAVMTLLLIITSGRAHPG